MKQPKEVICPACKQPLPVHWYGNLDLPFLDLGSCQCQLTQQHVQTVIDTVRSEQDDTPTQLMMEV